MPTFPTSSCNRLLDFFKYFFSEAEKASQRSENLQFDFEAQLEMEEYDRMQRAEEEMRNIEHDAK